MKKKSIQIFVGDTWVYLPGAGNFGGGAAHTSYGAFLYGHSVLLRQKFPKTSSLVHGNRPV